MQVNPGSESPVPHISFLQPLSEADLVDEFSKDFSCPVQPAVQPKVPKPSTSKVCLLSLQKVPTLVILPRLENARILSRKVFCSASAFCLLSPSMQYLFIIIMQYWHLVLN